VPALDRREHRPRPLDPARPSFKADASCHGTCLAPHAAQHVPRHAAAFTQDGPRSRFLLLLTGGRSGPRASRPSRAVLTQLSEETARPRTARAGFRGCALRSLWSLRPRMPGILVSRALSPAGTPQLRTRATEKTPRLSRARGVLVHSGRASSLSRGSLQKVLLQTCRPMARSLAHGAAQPAATPRHPSRSRGWHRCRRRPPAACPRHAAPDVKRKNGILWREREAKRPPRALPTFAARGMRSARPRSRKKRTLLAATRRTGTLVSGAALSAAADSPDHPYSLRVVGAKPRAGAATRAERVRGA